MAEQVMLPGGEFLMGSDRHYPDEAPVRQITVSPFAIDATPVTNDEFSQFVAETGHVTLAEVPPTGPAYEDVPPELLVPGSLVFRMTPGPVRLSDPSRWWAWVPGADWRHPLGPGSSLEGLGDHPVVHVAYEDALAFAVWAAKDLPTEAEWEFAARGGLVGAEFTWGEGDVQETRHPKANTWQGGFPYENTEVDGWTRTSPVAFYEPNGFGLYDMAGNVWEWTSDWYGQLTEQSPACCGGSNPLLTAGQGGNELDPPGNPPSRVVKGGSHLCTVQYCFRYRPAARQPQAIDTSTSHMGFRCVQRGDEAQRTTAKGEPAGR